MYNVSQKSSLKPVLLFVLGAVGTCISFVHAINLSFFGTVLGDASFALTNMFYQLTSTIFPALPDTSYILIVTAIILLSIGALIYNIIKNNLRTYSTCLLILNLFFSLPTLLMFFIGWGMNASS